VVAHEEAEFRRRFGQCIASIRRRKGCTQAELARRMDGPPFTEASEVSRWDRGDGLAGDPQPQPARRGARGAGTPARQIAEKRFDRLPPLTRPCVDTRPG
jgi:transcriptional regulator with XRE-family HTH domain